MNLADLLPKLEASGLPATLEGNTLTAKHGPYAVRAEVVPAEGPATPGREIEGVIRVSCGVPEGIAPHLSNPEAALAVNRLTAFGALTIEGDKAFIGSRLTVYKGEEHAWPTLHLPLVLFAMMVGAEPIVGGLRREAAKAPAEAGASDWTADDFKQIEERFKGMAECAVEAATFNAEFELAPGDLAAASEDGARHTALLQMSLDHPHPEMGAGLSCILQLPHRVGDLARVCSVLNEREMAARDLPPHFGAWCAGSLGDNPAYVMFLPNALRLVQGIAINVAYWAVNRARWADSLLVAAPAQ